ncbi:MAG TPA: thiamine phosphate synthase [Anaerolineae bacterium]|nr:thiamine phosphate synthase [Anaerolineae bacterium]
MDWTLYVITDRRWGRSHLEVARAAIAGGATAIQLRDKEATTRELIEVGLALRELTRERGVAFIVNDRVDVALAVDADGVHVGQDDMPAKLARRLMGPKIVGVSAGSVEEALRAEADGADYVSASPVFATPTKPDAPPPTGLEGLRAIAEAVRIPVIAIGGINEDNVGEVIRAGADGVAVISAVVAAPDIAEAARRLRQRIEEARK